MNLFTLAGSIFIDNDKANESITKTDKKAESLGKQFQKGAKTVGKWGLALGGACAAGATALMGMATKSAEATDRIDKMSQKIGISRQAFQEWDFIASQSGTSVDKLQTGLKTMTAQMDMVTEGNKNAIANFEKLGVSIYDSTGKLKSQEQMFEESVKALQNMEDGTEKARLATELFGKSGQELMPLLNGAAGSVDEMKAKAHELGLVMSDEAVDSGVKFTDTIDQLKRSFGTIVSEVGVEVMPLIQTFAEWTTDNMPKIKKVVSKTFEIISIAVRTAVDVIKVVVEWFQNIAKASQEEGSKTNKIWTDIKEFFMDTFNNIIEFVKAFIQLFQAFWEKWGDTITIYLKGVWEQIKIVFDVAFKIINDLLKIFTALFKGDWEGLWEGIKQLCLDIWNGINDLIQNSLDVALNILKNIIPKMLQAGKNIMTGVWDGIKDVWNNITEWVSEKVEWLADKLTFWDNGVQDMSESTPSSYAQGNSSSGNTSYYNGSHANGLSYVPYDGYIAKTHLGEGILTEEENREYKRLKNESNKQKVVVDNKETNDLLRQLIKRLDNMPIKLRNENLTMLGVR